MDEVLSASRDALRPVPTAEGESLDDPQGGGMGYLLGHLLRFGQLLRVMGVEASTRQILDLVEALEHVPITDRADFYHTCKALLVNRREDFLVFDQAFEFFWRVVMEEASVEELAGDARLKRLRLPSRPGAEAGASGDNAEGHSQEPGASESNKDEALLERLMIYSPDEALRHKEFSEMTWEEIQAAKQAIASLEWKLGERRTRRARHGRQGRINLRRTIRDNLRHGGEPIHLAFRQRVYRPRSLVILCDISGSMERYSRLLLHFVHALTHGLGDTSVETFVFGTRLTRISRHLRYKDVDEALDGVGDEVRDWSGGTRIGEALRTFNFQWARRVLGRGAVVLVISDGWDRGDLQLLANEIHRLQRSSYRLIWLNPLLGSDEYQPVQRGMATVLPCVDDFLPVHNLASLEQLAEVLSSVATYRPVRKQRVCAPQIEEQKPKERVQPVGKQPDWYKAWQPRVG